MTSQLSRQLVSLSAPETSILDHYKKRASILFSASEAAAFPSETYFNIGLSGFSELLEINDQFKKFEKDLFGITSKDFQRYIQTKKSNYELDEKIEEFLLILSPYLQKQASLKTLEWLIYRFYIHEKNVDSLMMCILPYYETVLFVRILQILDIRSDKSPWNWLHKSQTHGRPLSKITVFLHWSSNQSFRNFISNYFQKMIKVSKRDEHVQISVSLLISTQIGGLASAQKINENHMSSVCQTLQKCLSLNSSHALFGTFLMISQLSISSQLSQDLLQEIVYKIAQISDASYIRNSTVCLLTVFYHQNIKSIRHPTLKLIEANEELFQEISKQSSKKPVGPFLSMFTKDYIRMTLKNETLSEEEKKEEIEDLVKKIQSMPMLPSDSSRIIRSFLKALSECEPELKAFSENRINIVYLLKNLEVNHPEGFDMACTRVMKPKKTDVITYEQKIIKKFKKVYEIKVLTIENKVVKNDQYPEEQWLSCLKSGKLSSTCIAFLEKISSTINLSNECKEHPFWCISGQDEFSMSLKLLVKLLKVIVAHQMQKTNSTICNGLLKNIFKEKLGNLKSKIYFLSMILGYNLENEDAGIDRSLKLWALNLTSALLASESSSCSLSWVLDAKEPLVTSLLIPICEGSFLCEASFKVLQNMHCIVGGRLKADNLSVLVEGILSKKEEIGTDISYLPLTVKILANKSKGEGAHLVKILFSCATNSEVPLHIRSTILYSLSKINDKEILAQLIPIGNEYLDEIATRKEAKFDVSKSTFLYYILIRFVSENSPFLEVKGGWELFLRSLQMPHAILQVQDRLLSPQELVVNYKILQSLSNSEKLLEVLEVLLNRIVKTNCPEEASKLSKELKKISLNATQIISIWNKYNIIPKFKSVQEARAAKRLKQQSESKTLANMEDWQKLGLLIELIGVMENLKSPWMLIGPICDHMQLLMKMESSFSDTLQQQMLSVCYHLMTLCKSQLDKKDFTKQCKLNVALIVQCIRSSVNPDVHRRALLILSLAAEYFPDQVLHNIMAIFTFMGTSLLRRDDAYSFHVIHLTIDSIVPALIKAENSEPKVLLKKLSQVTQVFVDALPDLAEHRRLPLFTQLATTLGVSQYLWLVMVLISDAYVSRNTLTEELSSQEVEPRRLPHNIYFALVLYSQFSVIDQLKASCEVVNFVINLPHSKESYKVSSYNNVQELHSSTFVINMQTKSSRQLRQIKYTCLGLIVNLVTSERFIGQVYEVIESDSKDEMNKLKELYERLLAETLEYLKFVCQQIKSQKESQFERFWSAMERKLADLIDAVNAILPPELLIEVVSKLLNTKSDTIRCRAMEILASKLQPDAKFFKDEFVNNLLGFVEPLLKIALNNKEQEETRQIALFSLQLMVRRMNSVDDPTVISPILASSTALTRRKDLSTKVLTQATLVIAESIHAMKKFSLIYVNEVFPSLLSILEHSLKEEESPVVDNLQIAASVALLRVVENVPRLLPRNYVETLITIICQMMSKEEENDERQRESKLTSKLIMILDLLVQNVESRVLLPCLSKTFEILSLKDDAFSLPSLMKFIEVMLSSLKPAEISIYKKHLNQLFINALDTRTSRLSLDEKTMNHVESCVISALTRFLLKLNGEDNVAFIKILIKWAWKDLKEKPSRLITFFRFASRLASGLKVLFIKTNIAAQVHPKAAEILDQNNNCLNDHTVFGKGIEAEVKASELIKYVLETLSNIYIYDSVNFTNKLIFAEIVKPLTKQIENTIGTEEDFRARISNYLKTCIIKFTKAIDDDSLWKELNNNILTKIRATNDSKVILAGLEIFEGIVEALGEDYLQPLLADTIPTIIEMLESLNENVEKKTKEIFVKMEAILGDSLRAYLET